MALKDSIPKAFSSLGAHKILSSTNMVISYKLVILKLSNFLEITTTYVVKIDQTSINYKLTTFLGFTHLKGHWKILMCFLSINVHASLKG